MLCRKQPISHTAVSGVKQREEVSFTVEDVSSSVIRGRHPTRDSASGAKSYVTRPESPFAGGSDRAISATFSETDDHQAVPIQPVSVSHGGASAGNYGQAYPRPGCSGTANISLSLSKYIQVDSALVRDSRGRLYRDHRPIGIGSRAPQDTARIRAHLGKDTRRSRMPWVSKRAQPTGRSGRQVPALSLVAMEFGNERECVQVVARVTVTVSILVNKSRTFCHGYRRCNQRRALRTTRMQCVVRVDRMGQMLGDLRRYYYTGTKAACNQLIVGGQKRRERVCRNGRECAGPADDIRSCGEVECPNWAEWLSWGDCSTTCGKGQKARIRSII